MIKIVASLLEVKGWLEEAFEVGSTEEQVSIDEIEDFIKRKPEVNGMRVLLPRNRLIEVVASCFPSSQCVEETEVLYPLIR